MTRAGVIPVGIRGVLERERVVPVVGPSQNALLFPGSEEIAGFAYGRRNRPAKNMSPI